MLGHVNCIVVLFGTSAFQPTRGRIYPLFFPLPVSFDHVASDGSCAVSNSFSFILGDSPSHVLQEATTQYNQYLKDLTSYSSSSNVPPCRVSDCSVSSVSPAEVNWFEDTNDESYTITFEDSGCKIKCEKIYGCMHAMKTFVQMIDPLMGSTVPNKFTITDKPRFAYRGLLIDSARHFLPVTIIKQHIDMMSATKMNVLHWHLTDDHSFPIWLPSIPELADKGAYSPRAIYSPESVREIVAYANDRGIKILPEIDVPAHTVSWFKSHPELTGMANDVMDPTSPITYNFIREVVNDVVDLFNTKVIHLGGDEVDNAWNTRGINDWLERNKMTPSDLIHEWIRGIHEIAVKLDIRVIMWEDFLERIDDSAATVKEKYPRISWHMWKRSWPKTQEFSATNQGTIFSSSFYLDHLDLKWSDLYSVDLREDASAKMAGAEACMWGEWVDESNVLQRTWPRAAAVAERLWTQTQEDFSTATKRLAKFRCRMREFWDHRFIEPLGSARADKPDEEWSTHTDKAQWYCPEADLHDQTSRSRKLIRVYPTSYKGAEQGASTAEYIQIA